MRFSTFSAALIASIVGFAGTLPLVLTAAEAVGASPAQTASWVTAICLAIGLETLILSVWLRIPSVTAWSVAGLALVGASEGFTINEATGAFIVAGALLIATGLFRPLTWLVDRIPTGVSAGMLAGIILPFVMQAAGTVSLDPGFVLPLIVLFFLLRLWNPALAIVAVLVAGVAIALTTGRSTGSIEPAFSGLVAIAPHFDPVAIIALALPTYLVTMASQNLPGIAVLKTSGYEPKPGPMIGVTGAFSTISALFGASTTNLSALTAAICTGPDAHPDPQRRWLTGPWYAAFYFLFAAFGASLIATVAAMPATLIHLILGLALLAPLANAMAIALRDENERLAGVITLAVTASGLSIFGVGSAFWGLVAGLVVFFSNFFHWRKLQ
ncbi:benzoate/H(+) symporter BenE family transporter [Oricola sp.]|uniref:benzoate/H(+) symporter BenE family transporter n=1 Tax=Oricola sp. TaxID=1979950 RepID=UPI003BAA1F2A